MHIVYLNLINHEGGRRMELVDIDLSRLREEFLESIYQSEIVMTRMIAELEVKFDKLELPVAKMAAGSGGAASDSG